MKIRYLIIAILICLFAVPGFAMDNTALPQGIFIIQFGLGYSTATERFTQDFGFQREDLAEDYRVYVNGWELDPGNTLLENVSFGKIDANFDSWGIGFETNIGIGITDNVSFMIMIPTQYIHQTIQPRLISPADAEFWEGAPADVLARQDSIMGVGLSEIDGIPNNIFPTSDESQYMTSADLIKILESDKDGVTENFYDNYGDFVMDYDTIQDYIAYGIRDMRLALRYRFFGNDETLFTQAMTVMVVIPTGRMDDPDMLLDSAHGDGQWDLGFFYGVDVRPVDGLWFNVSLGYTDAFLQTMDVRIPMAITRNEKGEIIQKIPIGDRYKSKCTAIRDIGGNIDAWLSGGYSILPYLSIGFEIYFYYKFQDDYQLVEYPQYLQDLYADQGETLEYQMARDSFTEKFDGLEFDTILSSADLNVGLGFTTLPFFMDGKFPIPFNVDVGFMYSLFGLNSEINIGGYFKVTFILSVEIFGVDLNSDGEDEIGEMDPDTVEQVANFRF